jgi:hypothetical protein
MPEISRCALSRCDLGRRLPIRARSGAGRVAAGGAGHEQGGAGDHQRTEPHVAVPWTSAPDSMGGVLGQLGTEPFAQRAEQGVGSAALLEPHLIGEGGQAVHARIVRLEAPPLGAVLQHRLDRPPGLDIDGGVDAQDPFPLRGWEPGRRPLGERLHFLRTEPFGHRRGMPLRSHCPATSGFTPPFAGCSPRAMSAIAG